MSAEISVSPYADISVADLAAVALDAKVAAELLESSAKGAREEVHARMLRSFRTDGVKPTLRAPAGTFSLTGGAKPGDVGVLVKDDDEFASWVAQRSPDEVVSTIEIPTKDLAEVLDLLESVVQAKATSRVRPAYTKALLSGVEREVDDDGSVTYVDTKSGEPVEGLGDVPSAMPSLSFRANPDAVERAKATLAERLRGITERLTVPALDDARVIEGEGYATAEAVMQSIGLEMPAQTFGHEDDACADPDEIGAAA